MSGPGGQIDRRSFFKVIATSGAAAAASGCSRPAGELLSLVTPPEEIIPGVATYFATTCRECPSGCGVLAKNRDGRIIVTLENGRVLCFSASEMAALP